jgi:hypothetical protein
MGFLTASENCPILISKKVASSPSETGYGKSPRPSFLRLSKENTMKGIVKVLVPSALAGGFAALA